MMREARSTHRGLRWPPAAERAFARVGRHICRRPADARADAGVGAGHFRTHFRRLRHAGAHPPEAQAYPSLRRSVPQAPDRRRAARRSRPGERLLRAHLRRLLLPGAGPCRRQRRRSVPRILPGEPDAALFRQRHRPRRRIGRQPLRRSRHRLPLSQAAGRRLPPATAATRSGWRTSTSTPIRRCGPATWWRPGAAWWRSPA